MFKLIEERRRASLIQADTPFIDHIFILHSLSDRCCRKSLSVSPRDLVPATPILVHTPPLTNSSENPLCYGFVSIPPSRLVMLVPAGDGSWRHCPQIAESQTAMNDESSAASATSCWAGWCDSLTQQASNHFPLIFTNQNHVNTNGMLDDNQCEMPRRSAQAGGGLKNEVIPPHQSWALRTTC